MTYERHGGSDNGIGMTASTASFCTAAFFGRPFNGLELVDRALTAAPDELLVPRAQDVTRLWLGRALAGEAGGRRAALTPRQRLAFQTASFAVNVHRKLRPTLPQIWNGASEAPRDAIRGESQAV